jgi:hypothetical protein
MGSLGSGEPASDPGGAMKYLLLDERQGGRQRSAKPHGAAAFGGTFGRRARLRPTQSNPFQTPSFSERLDAQEDGVA